MENQVGTIVIITSFKAGDWICHKELWDKGYLLFTQASVDDVHAFSGKGYEYVMIIKTV